MFFNKITYINKNHVNSVTKLYIWLDFSLPSHIFQILRKNKSQAKVYSVPLKLSSSTISQKNNSVKNIIVFSNPH